MIKRIIFLLSAIILISNNWMLNGTESNSPEIIKLPVRVHRFTSDEEPRLHCTLSDEEIREQFVIVNQTWAQASIVWEIESIVDAVAQKPKDFTDAIDSPDGKLAPPLVSNMPTRQLLKGGFNVAIAEDYERIGGVFRPQNEGIVFYAKKGPKGVQTPAVLAHELGHALGLPHTIFEKDNNLMVGSGEGRVPTLTKPITPSQITIARQIAQTGKPFSPQSVKSPAGSPQQIWEYLDPNGDGVMTVTGVGKKHRLFAVEFLRKASRAPLDFLTKEQYDFITEQQQQKRQQAQRRESTRGGNAGGRVWGSGIVPQMFSRYDKNGDGIITREEASQRSSLVNEYFDKWDSETNGDGELTAEEVTTRLTEEPAVQGALR